MSAPSIASTLAAQPNTLRARLAAASMIGTTLEWYDFTIYNTMAALIFNQVFFPAVDPLAGILLAFSTYAVGYVSRPLGGMVFGHLGDKLGRRAVLMITLVLMGLTTAAIGLLPSYSAIGVLSPLLLVTLRFLQGVALGGEWAGAVLLSMEHGRQDRRGLNASWTQVGPSGGTLVATAAITVLTASLSDADFVAWGWRVPFLLSLVLVAFGLWVRLGVEETPMFEALESSHRKAEAPVNDVLRHHWRRLFIAAGCRVGSDVHFALIVVFTLTYLTAVLHLSRDFALRAVLIAAVFNAISVPLFGLLSDVLGRRLVYGFGAALAVLFAFAYFPLLDTMSAFVIVLAAIAGLILHSMMFGPQAAFVAEQFATPVRYTGCSLAYTFAGVVGGGFAPLLMAYLYQRFGNTLAVSWYVAAALGVTLAAILAAKETAKRPLEE
ncbi:MAG TPA: MFS transporter [Micropepsaceae bacterium]|nr:MFS transporter [Micropepsaceae bacterium]